MKLEDGTTVNMGVQVIEQLKENKSIGWQFVDSSDEAISGVESGKYYAAVVIGDRFSESMFSIFLKDWRIRPLHIMRMRRKCHCNENYRYCSEHIKVQYQ